MAGREAGAWCVLRCAGRRTLGLAESLAGEGFEVWTPKVPPKPKPEPEPDKNGRRPRSRCRRRCAPDGDMVPLIATFVFARDRHLEDLVMLSGRRQFSVMFDKIRQRGFVVVADHSLNHLRKHEADAIGEAERRKPKPPAEPFGPGEEIMPPDGPYKGLPGIVETSDGKHTWIDFGGIMGRVKVETFWLRDEREAA